MITITKNGKPLDKSLYDWNEDTRVFSSLENGLTISTELDGCTFKTGHDCTFKTGSFCTFKTGSYCTFTTGGFCTFKTGWGCTFKTGSGCTFDTGYNCTFTTGNRCTFDAGYGCTFTTGDGCTFKTGDGCIFKTGEECVVVRRDVFEVILLEEGQEIKLNDIGEMGFTVVEDEKEQKKKALIAKAKELLAQANEM